jgi:tetratricopeptide (TPR) repeat protein
MKIKLQLALLALMINTSLYAASAVLDQHGDNQQATKDIKGCGGVAANIIGNNNTLEVNVYCSIQKIPLSTAEKRMIQQYQLSDAALSKQLTERLRVKRNLDLYSMVQGLLDDYKQLKKQVSSNAIDYPEYKQEWQKINELIDQLELDQAQLQIDKLLPKLAVNSKQALDNYTKVHDADKQRAVELLQSFRAENAALSAKAAIANSQFHYQLAADSYGEIVAKLDQLIKLDRSFEPEVAEELAKALGGQGMSLQDAGDYSNHVRDILERALAIRERNLGPEYISTARSLNILAGFYSKQGNYDAALPLYKRALEIREKILEPENSETAISLGNLAALYSTQGDYDAAMPLYKRALEIDEKVLGPEHHETAVIMSNLAGLYCDQGNYAAALPLYKRALEIHEKGSGLEHPFTAFSLNNLASLYQEQGDYDTALPLYQRALAIREKTLGPLHPETANSLDSLAALYLGQSNYNVALPLSKRALAINEKVLGPEHPNTALSLQNLAALNFALGNNNAALSLYQRVLAIYEKVLGPDHPYAAITLSNIAGIYLTQGNYQAALPLEQRALAIYEKKLGSKHPNTVKMRNDLDQLLKLQQQGK